MLSKQHPDDEAGCALYALCQGLCSMVDPSVIEVGLVDLTTVAKDLIRQVTDTGKKANDPQVAVGGVAKHLHARNRYMRIHI